jgi:uncharacterized membrane-anchored protein YitT (DUF2179 family)
MKENFNLRLAWEDIKADLTSNRWYKTVFKYLLIVFGSILLAAGDALFLIPYNIVSGGVAGLGIVLVQAFPSWDVNLTITVLQWTLFFLGFVLLGARFSLRTLISTLVYPISLYAFDRLLSDQSFANWVSLGAHDETAALILAGGFGGALVGIGCGLTFIGGGSTGGTDCLSLSLTKYFHIKASVGSLTIDMVIILSNLFFAKNVLIVIIGMVSAFLCAVFIDKTYIGDNSYVGFIVSDKWEEINRQINTTMERGTTLIDSYGGYTGKDKVMIEVAFTTDEYDDIQKLVFKIDPKAFMTILDAYEVTGYGFRKVPFRINREIQFEEKQLSKENNKLNAKSKGKKYPSSKMQYLQTRPSKQDAIVEVKSPNKKATEITSSAKNSSNKE